MKIIEKGQGNQVKCPSCGSTLEFQPHDITRRNTGRDDDGDECYFYSVQCPSCRHSVSVNHITSAMRSVVANIHKSRDLSDYDV